MQSRDCLRWMGSTACAKILRSRFWVMGYTLRLCKLPNCFPKRCSTYTPIGRVCMSSLLRRPICSWQIPTSKCLPSKGWKRVLWSLFAFPQLLMRVMVTRKGHQGNQLQENVSSQDEITVANWLISQARRQSPGHAQMQGGRTNVDFIPASHVLSWKSAGLAHSTGNTGNTVHEPSDSLSCRSSCASCFSLAQPLPGSALSPLPGPAASFKDLKCILINWCCITTKLCILIIFTFKILISSSNFFVDSAQCRLSSMNSDFSSFSNLKTSFCCTTRLRLTTLSNRWDKSGKTCLSLNVLTFKMIFGLVFVGMLRLRGFLVAQG